MANNLFVSSSIVSQALIKNLPQFYTSQSIIGLCNKIQNFDPKITGANTQSSIALRYPTIFQARKGYNVNPVDIQDILQRTTPLKVNLQEQTIAAPIAVDISEQNFNINEVTAEGFSSQYLNGTMDAMSIELAKELYGELDLGTGDFIGDTASGLTVQSGLQIQSMITLMGLAQAGLNPGSRENFYTATSSNSIAALAYSNLQNFTLEKNDDVVMNDCVRFNSSAVKFFSDNLIIPTTNGGFNNVGGVTVSTSVPANNDINQDYTTITLGGFTPSTSDVLRAGNILKFSVNSDGSDPVMMLAKKTFVNTGVPAGFVVVSDDTGNEVVSSDGLGNASIRIRKNPVADASSSVRNISKQLTAGTFVQLVGGANNVYQKNFVLIRGLSLGLELLPIQPYMKEELRKDAPGGQLAWSINRGYTAPGSGMSMAFNIQGWSTALDSQQLYIPRIWPVIKPFADFYFCYLSQLVS